MVSNNVKAYQDVPNNFKNIYIINRDYIMNLRNNSINEIPYNVNQELIKRAKDSFTYDFAFFND